VTEWVVETDTVSLLSVKVGFRLSAGCTVFSVFWEKAVQHLIFSSDTGVGDVRPFHRGSNATCWVVRYGILVASDPNRKRYP